MSEDPESHSEVSHQLSSSETGEEELPDINERPPNLLSNASVYSQLTFSWPLPLIRKGMAKDIKESEIPDIMPDEDSDRNRLRFEQVWDEELAISVIKGKPASLHRALLRLYFRTLWYVQPAIALTSISRIGQALALERLVAYFEGNVEEGGQGSDGYLWAGVLIACAAVPLLSHHQTYFRAWRMGMQLRIGAVSAIYNKSLRLSTVGSTKTTTAGELSNLASNDVERFLYASLFISYLFWAPMEAVAVLCVGLHTLGPAFAAGYIVLFTFVPMQFYLGHKFANSRSQIAKLTDKRVSLISQAIQGVRVMKMNGWEFEFSERISQLRGEEVKSVQVASKYRALNEAIFYATNTSVAICIFVVHVLTGHELNTHDVFATLTLINIVQFTMTKFFAYSVMSCSECYVSVQRIQHFLELPELKDTSTVINDGQSIIEMSNVSSFWGPPVMLSHEEVSEKDERHLKRLITPKNAPRSPISWMTREKPNDIVSSKGPIVSRRRSDQVETMVRAPAVENVSLMLDPGRLYCVVGPVGCGKSALLMTIAGELQPDFGSIKRTVSSVAFAAQTAWIMDGTLRENVLMGREYVRAKYEEVIHACGLSPDISRFHLGDQTLLGDRGIQCSGGQQARIGLARALYADADLILLDDPLSAVDSKVARLIFQAAIKDLCLAKGKCVVLATHQYQLIENETCILMKRGCVLQVASFQDCIEISEGLLKPLHRTSGDRIDTPLEMKARTESLPAIEGDALSHPNTVNAEAKESGDISNSTWGDYCRAMGGKWVVMGILSLFAFSQVALLVTIASFGRWAERPFQDQSSPVLLSVIVLLGLSVVILSLVRSLLAFCLTIRASRRLHDAMAFAVIRAKIEFFDTNPLGRILNRFSADIGSNDDQLPTSLNDTVSIGFLVVGAIVSAAAVLPFILIVVPPIFLYFIRIRRMFISASQELKRFEGVARSPIHGMMSESFSGISSIRANGAIEYFKRRFANTQNAHSRAFFSFIACTRWLNFRLESIQIALFSVACSLAVFVHDRRWFLVDPAMLGLALSLLLQMSGLLQWAVRQSCEVISNMIAVERVSAYSKLEPEAPLEMSTDRSIKAGWPTNGSLKVTDLTVRYRKSLPVALSHLTFEAKGGHRVAIVGRTGSGKSTFLQALFRLLEAEQGKIEIDEEDISGLGLHMLRKRISVIPQTPILFSGWSLRDNLDPFQEYSDEQIIDSIFSVQLEVIYNDLPAGLDTLVADCGNNFSVGQRQLLCVARAMLQKNKLVVLDEPTANVDPQTDALLQKALSTNFPGATVVAIAHRLETIIDYDQVLVIGDGKALEFGPPSQLLQRDGPFAAMVDGAGIAMARELRRRAFGQS